MPPARVSGSRGPRFQSVLVLMSLGLLALAWEWGLRAFHVPEYLIPPLHSVVRVMRDQFWTMIWPHTSVTLLEVVIGFLIGSPLGIVLGMVISQSRALERFLSPYILAVQCAPKIAFAPLFVIWFGFGIGSKIFMVVSIVFFPVMMNALAGFKEVDALKLELMRSYCASRWQTLIKIRVPGAVPFILAGLKIAVVWSVLGAVAGEFVGAREGLGYLVLYSGNMLETDILFAAIAMLVMMGMTLYALFYLLERRVLRMWGVGRHSEQGEF